MNQKRIWIFLFFLLPVSHAAGEGVILTIEEAVQRAMEQSINLQKSEIDLALSEYSAANLWSEIFPGFSLSTGMTILPNTPLFTDPGFNYNTDNLSYSINLGISLSLNPSLRPSMRRIELAYRSQLLSYESAQKQIEIQVVKDFLRLVLREEHLLLMQETLNVAQHKLEQDRIARQNGLLSELAWLNSQLSAETARHNLSDAQNTYQNALGEFLALLGMEAGTNLVFEGSIDIAPVSFDSEALILEYLPRRPDIIRQRQTIERLELTQNINTLSSRSPTLNLSTQWRGGTPTGGQRGGLGDPFTDNISGSITLNIPIDSWIPGTRQNQALRSAGAEVEKARLDLNNMETTARTQIRSLISNLNNISASLEIARMRVEIAQRTVEATEEGFRNGTVEFRDLEDRRRDHTDARQRLLEGEFTYQSLMLDLAAALNVDWRLLTRQ